MDLCPLAQCHKVVYASICEVLLWDFSITEYFIYHKWHIGMLNKCHSLEMSQHPLKHKAGDLAIMPQIALVVLAWIEHSVLAIVVSSLSYSAGIKRTHGVQCRLCLTSAGRKEHLACGVVFVLHPKKEKNTWHAVSFLCYIHRKKRTLGVQSREIYKQGWDLSITWELESTLSVTTFMSYI